MLEKIIIKKNKKNKPPIHWDEDRQRISVGSRYFISLKIEKPVPVNPDIDSKKSAEWHKSMGMNVKTHWKSGFNHTFANDIPGHEDFNPKIDCANISLAMDPLP